MTETKKPATVEKMAEEYAVEHRGYDFEHFETERTLADDMIQAFKAGHDAATREKDGEITKLKMEIGSLEAQHRGDSKGYARQLNTIVELQATIDTLRAALKFYATLKNGQTVYEGLTEKARKALSQDGEKI